MAKAKKCTRCGKKKPLSGFYRHRSHKDGRDTICKQCNREHRAQNVEHYRAIRAKYTASHLEEIHARGRKYAAKYAAGHRRVPGKQAEYQLQHRYGLSLAEYDKMLEAQDNGCAICGKTPEENGKRLCVDHDHATGETRGLLCSNCNIGMGRLQDDPRLCRMAALYLEKYK